MSILLAQLGDVHVKEMTDCAIRRAPQIGAAIASEITSNTASVVLAICGDVTYSGTVNQFGTAKILFDSLEKELRDRCSDIGLVRVVVPGNHDCNLSGDQTARNVVLESIKESKSPPESVRDIVLGPLSEYFRFAEMWAGDAYAITDKHPFYNAVDLPDGECRMRLHLVNTAWMSSINDRPGSLHFPLPEIVPPADRVDYSIAILHHPTNWFAQPHAMRALRDRIGELASVVLVNHEHISEAQEQTPLFGWSGEVRKTLYVSGGVIQASGQPELCSFNLIDIDGKAKSVRLARYDYRTNAGMPFFERTANETVGISAGELSVGPAGVSLSHEMIATLNDPGVPIAHPRRDPRIPVHLSDIFLYPDLWELDTEHEGADQRQIRSHDVETQILGTAKVLITGGEKSGRTAIAKKLFMGAFDTGKVPVLLTGKRIPKSPEMLRNAIRKAVSEQYSNCSPDAYEQLRPNKRVVLVDDIHWMTSTTDARRGLLQELERQFGNVILCGDDLIKLDEMNGRDARASGLWEYRHLIILGFGEYLREEFVRKWLMLGGDTVLNDAEMGAEVSRICSLLNMVIRKQLLPPYPLFLLVVLQQSDLANASVQNGSFGKLFEGVITAILSRSGFNRISIGDKYHYLAALSKEMFDKQTMSLSIDSARRWHRLYWDGIELDIEFDSVFKDLSSLGVLAVNDADVRFKYPYFFCFFVAYYLNRTIHEPETRELISQLSQQLHHRVSADIVLFLAHLTGDPFVLDEMASTCDRLFGDVQPASLESDVDPINRLGNIVETLSIPDEPDENRRKMKLRQDALVSERLAATTSIHDIVPPTAENEAIRRLFEIHAAYKTIQILGQALRNVAGSASKDRKEEVLRKIVGLSRRVLGVYFELFRNDVLPDVIEEMAMAHKEQQPDLAVSDLHKEVCRHLVGVSQFVCFGLIKHTTSSVGSENLSPTIHRVLESCDGAIARILDLSFSLERSRPFPRKSALKLYEDLRKNRFSASLVRMLVAYRIYLYVVPYKDRHSVCEKMSIQLLPSVLDRTRKRLIH